MPMSKGFEERLYPKLQDIVAHYGTPFHIYDEQGIRETGEALSAAFSVIAGFREYYGVKALPNPRILGIMDSMGFGFDCSSIAELILSRRAGGRGEDLMFTSNNTSQEEFIFKMILPGSVGLLSVEWMPPSSLHGQSGNVH